MLTSYTKAAIGRVVGHWNVIKVGVIPLDNKEALVNQVAETLRADWSPDTRDLECVRDMSRENARSVLRNLGLL
jgi:hypothetical protein